MPLAPDFTTASDRQRLEGFLRRGCRQNLCSTGKPFIAQIVEEADENPSHLLHQLLPRRTESSYSWRSRPHNFELSHIHDDRNMDEDLKSNNLSLDEATYVA